MNIHLYSLHGLFRARFPELGRDADNGGQITYVLELACALSRRPEVTQVTLVTRRIDDPQLDPCYAAPEERVNDKFVIQRVNFGGSAYRMKEALWPHLDECVEELVRQARTSCDYPEIIHGHYADAGYVSARVSAALGVPFLHTGHSLGHPKLERLIADGLSRENAMSTYSFAPRFEAEDLTLANAEFIVTSSRLEIEHYNTYPHAKAAHYEVIPPGVDFQRFSPWYETQTTLLEKQGRVRVEHQLSRFLREPGKPLITLLCRADRKKNIEAIVRAYGEAPDLRAIANLALYVGQRHDIADKLPGEREVYERLLRLQDQFDLYGRLAMPKQHDPGIEVQALYRAAAQRRGVFVNMALTEPFGLTLLEAAASGLPVVATSDGGPAEIVPTLENGILADPNNIPGIQAALRALLTDEKRWLDCSLRGIRNVRASYNWENHVEQYLQRVTTIARQHQRVA